MCRYWSGFRTPIKWYQNKLLSSHLQAVDVQNATNKVIFAKSTSSDAFYYTCTSNGLEKTIPIHSLINETIFSGAAEATENWVGKASNYIINHSSKKSNIKFGLHVNFFLLQT